ncbi:uncharacterized protein LOC116134768 [Pistacia vera]|uniref:uncharacterized protein LOC116134768 n=1 Tax=Pistacia vera TaxID=55513 RepID=UPI00126372D6|nr:uncharacterized protein LOC116134768 [Pistacia vera]
MDGLMQMKMRKAKGREYGDTQEEEGDYITSEDVSKLKYTNKWWKKHKNGQYSRDFFQIGHAGSGIRRNQQGGSYQVFGTELEPVLETRFLGYKLLCFFTICRLDTSGGRNIRKWNLKVKNTKNWKVILWVRYLHTNPENFEDPMCFNPDRWNEPARSGTYQVFCVGPRICAGNMLARLQSALFLHRLFVGYKWELQNPDAEIIYLSHPKPVDGVEIISFSEI